MAWNKRKYEVLIFSTKTENKSLLLQLGRKIIYPAEIKTKSKIKQQLDF